MRSSVGDVRARLRAHRFLDGLDDGAIDLLAGCARLVSYRSGERIAREGDPADGLVLVLDGRVAVETHLPRRGTVVLATVEAGGVLGWSWLFPPHHWDFDATATTDVDAVLLDAEALRSMLADHPHLDVELTRRIGRAVTERLVDARRRLLDLYAPPSPELST